MVHGNQPLPLSPARRHTGVPRWTCRPASQPNRHGGCLPPSPAARKGASRFRIVKLLGPDPTKPPSGLHAAEISPDEAQAALRLAYAPGAEAAASRCGGVGTQRSPRSAAHFAACQPHLYVAWEERGRGRREARQWRVRG